MSTSTATSDVGTSTEFGSENLISNAQAYRDDAQIVNAASKYDNVDDAIAALKSVWAILESQVKKGSGYTPDVGLGFGSANAAQIAEKLMGKSTGVSATRKAFATMGKK